MILKDIHGFDIRYNVFVNYFKQETGQIESSISWLRNLDNVPSFVLRVLFMMNADKYDEAITALSHVIDQQIDSADNATFDISHLVSETGYEWIFSRATLNAIQEHKNMYSMTDLLVSAEFLMIFLLSRCYRNQNNVRQVETQFKCMKAMLAKQELYSFSESLLWSEVANMRNNGEKGPSSLVYIIRKLEKNIICDKEQQMEVNVQNKTEPVPPRANLRNDDNDENGWIETLHGIFENIVERYVNFRVGVDDGEGEGDDVDEDDDDDGDDNDEDDSMKALTAKMLSELFSTKRVDVDDGEGDDVDEDDDDDGDDNDEDDSMNHGLTAKMLSELFSTQRPEFGALLMDMIQLLYSQLQRSVLSVLPSIRIHELHSVSTMKKLLPMVEQFTNVIGRDKIEKLMKDFGPTDSSTVTIGMKYDSIMKKAFEVTPQIMSEMTPELLSLVNAHRKIVFTNESNQQKSETTQDFVHLNELNLNDYIRELTEKLVKPKTILHQFPFSGHLILKDVIHCFCPILFGHDSFFESNAMHEYLSYAPRFAETLLLTSGNYTIADMIYISQMRVHENYLDETIPELNRVAAMEVDNPASVVVWPEELEMILDDDVKYEIHKSSLGYIVVPSVVYGLYLLARIHISRHDEKERDTKQVRESM